MYKYNKEYLTYNDRPILPIMGEFHFSRYPRDEWRRALDNMKLGGVEIVATYIFWIHHEEKRGEWNFHGQRSLRDFLVCCQKAGLKVWLRIGPWAHGECRNGGFPDWLVDLEKRGELKTRTNHPAYLSLADRFYSKIGQQAAGFMDAEGGPVIGIQIENEYGHAGGPSDREEGMAHMRELKRLAEKNGLLAPYYSATGWGGAYVPEGFLAVLGGYVDAPWADHTHEMEASENFLFQPFHDDSNIGSDLAKGEASFTFDPAQVPYLTAELGGGLQVTSHRRTYPYPEDIEAQTVCMLGAGANLIGYYMYHGGSNPEGKYSTLQESKETGYHNDLPIKSYDFQACLRENGLPSASYYKLRKHHIFIHAVQELLAPARPFLPSGSGLPDGAEDMEALRACLRYNSEADCGFLFINNHQRKRRMSEKWVTKEKPLRFTLSKEKQICFDRIHIPPAAILILPYNLPISFKGEAVRLYRTNASYLGCFGGIYYFYTEEERENLYFEWSDGQDHFGEIKILTRAEAERFCVPQEKEAEASFLPTVMFEKAGWTEIGAGNCPNKNDGLSPREYDLRLHYSRQETEEEEVYLELDFGGDRGELYREDKLVADWFSNGEIWRVALRRYGYPDRLTLKIYPFEEEVYYDLAVRKENCLSEAALTRVKAAYFFDRPWERVLHAF